MRIAVVSNFFPPESHGGAEIYARDLSLELARRGCEVEVFTSTAGRQRIEEANGLVVRRFRTIPPLAPLTNDILGYNYNPWAAPLIRALSAAKCDLIHIHNLHTAVMLSPLLKAVHGPVVCHIHDHWPVCYRGILYDPVGRNSCVSERPSCCFGPGHRTIGSLNLRTRRRLLARFGRRVSAFIVPSYYMKETLTRRGFSDPEKVRVVPLGVDVNAMPKLGVTRPRLFSFVGRLVYYKNPQFILELAAQDKLHDDSCFQVVGSGPDHESLLKERARRKLSNVEITGGRPRNDTLTEIARSRAVIIPSLIPENSPLVAYEALACGTPVLCSSTGGTAEIVHAADAGAALHLDDLPAWRDTLSSLLEDQRFAEVSGQARAYATRHLSIRESGNGVMRVYEGATVW